MVADRPNSSHYNLTFKDDPTEVIEVPSDIALGVEVVNLWWTRETSADPADQQSYRPMSRAFGLWFVLCVELLSDGSVVGGQVARVE